MAHPLSAVLLLALSAGAREGGDESPRVLFLTHSAGFVHDVVRRPSPDELAPAERLLVEFGAPRFRVDCTQDCGAVNAENLGNYDAVLFMTTGELPIADADRAALMDWIAAGGAFAGVHCATDTLYQYAPYIEMIGGAFDGHPWHEEVVALVEEPGHPITKGLGASFPITDEIYQFRAFRRHPTRVLLTLDHGSVDVALGKREDGDYALAWTRDHGAGRVFYTALGHREEVWRDAHFQELLLNGLAWAIDGPDLPRPVPAGALVLFDGSDLAQWQHRGSAEEAAWRLVDGAMEVVAGTRDLVTREALGDGLYHVEFRTPSMPDAAGQARGNSGVYLLGRYEVQVLDSWGLEPGLGDCGAIYGKHVPAVNASRPPEVWQTYDVEFRAPRFDADGAKTENARMTVWHNGIRIHDDVEVDGPTAAGNMEEAPTGPLLLQDHGNAVRYRNVWVLPR